MRLQHLEVPMGFVPVGFTLDEDDESLFGWYWHEIKVCFNEDNRNRGRWRTDEENSLVAAMRVWVNENIGKPYYDDDDTYEGRWVLQDFDDVVNFIFLKQEDALLFKLRFA